MKTIGIITIHKINNYGSVLQAFALQKVLQLKGYDVEIIDYNFPNDFHKRRIPDKTPHFGESSSAEPLWIKALFFQSLIRQHKGIQNFVKKYQNLSSLQYNSPSELENNAPRYDVYISGSDQIWSPRHCKGDPAFMLGFTPDNSIKMSYASSIGSDKIPESLRLQYKDLLEKYHHIAIREKSGIDTLKELANVNPHVVLDPTLLLNADEWNKIANPRRLIRHKYILCYFLNYSFNAFPYVEDFAEKIRKDTGYELVFVARPPHRLTVSKGIHYMIGASPEDFLALIRDAELVLTTSFHGTAFALNYARPLFSIIKERHASDNRQADLMNAVGLGSNIISVHDDFPTADQARYDVRSMQEKLESLRTQSFLYLNKALK